jgi:S-methylmethionine-dependent homocysteine/selenocysteine methylase
MNSPKYEKFSWPLVLDGAIGSYLETKYPDLQHKYLWMNNFNSTDEEKSKFLYELYEEYIKSGAQIITSNTFSTHPACFYRADQKDNKSFYEIDYLNQSQESTSNAVEICKKIKKYNKDKGKTILIAGSNSPAECCYSSNRSLTSDQLKHNHHNHIQFLIDSGVDFVLNETLSSFDEIKIVAEYCQFKEVPYAISLIIDENLKIYSGESVKEVIQFIDENFKPLFISINCVFYKNFMKLITTDNSLFTNMKSKFGFYLNCGSENFYKTSEKSICSKDLPKILDEIFEIIDIEKIFCIGTCCMSDPSYTKEITNCLKCKENNGQ